MLSASRAVFFKNSFITYVWSKEDSCFCEAVYIVKTLWFLFQLFFKDISKQKTNKIDSVWACNSNMLDDKKSRKWILRVISNSLGFFHCKKHATLLTWLSSITILLAPLLERIEVLKDSYFSAELYKIVDLLVNIVVKENGVF